MQKKSTMKIAFVILVIFLTFTGGLVFVASKKLNPEELRKILITQIQSNLPNAKVETSDVQISLGIFSSSLKLNKFQIGLKEENSPSIFKVNNLSVRVPLWAIIFGGGKIIVDIEGPELSYIENKTSSNIQDLMKKESKKEDKKKKVSKGQSTKKEIGPKDLIVPGFVASSSLDIKISNMGISYKLRDNSSGKLNIERTLLKDLGLSTVTAFEIKSQLDILQNTDKSTTLNLLVIGETKLQEFIQNKEVNLRTSISLRNIKTALLKREIGSVSIDSDLSINDKLDIAGKVKILLEQRDFTSFILKKEKESLKILNINSKLPLMELSELALKPGTIPVKFDKNHILGIEGSIDIIPQINPDIVINLKKPILIDSGVVELRSILNAKYQGNKFEARIENDIWSGKAIVDLELNANANNFDISQMPPVKTKLQIRDIIIPQNFFNIKKSKSVDNSPTQGAPGKATIGKKQKDKLPHLPIAFDYESSLENISVNGANIKGLIKAKGKGDSFEISSRDLMIDDGKIEFKVKTKILDYALKNVFDFKISKVNIASADNFLPKDTAKGISGFVNGSLSGESRGEIFDVNINLGISDGEITKIDVKKIVEGYIETLSKYSKSITKKDLAIDGKFKSLKLVGNFKPTRHRFDSFSFIDNKEKIKLHGKGSVNLVGESKLGLELQVLDKKLQSKVRNEIGTVRLPVDLKGKGYALSPDYSKTINFLARKAAKAQVKKQGKKQIKKIIDKQLKNNKDLQKLIKKDKVNKLLNGLFQ